MGEVMSKSISFGRFQPADSFFHRLDARAKLIGLLLVTVTAMLTTALLFNLILAVVVASALLATGTGSGETRRVLLLVAGLAAVTSIYHLLFGGTDGGPAYKVWFMTFDRSAVVAAATYSLRMITFVLAVYLVARTGTADELSDGAISLLSPLRLLKLPIDRLGMVIFVALRFIPILHDEYTSLKTAQLIRGVRFSGSLMERISGYASIIAPLFNSAVNRADDLALSIEARGFRPDVGRSVYSRSVFGGAETMFLVLLALGLGGLYVWAG